jgi:hypothetical protein
MKKIYVILFAAFLFLTLNNVNAQILTSGFESWTAGVPDGWNGSKTNVGATNMIQYTTSVHGGASACELINTTTSHKRFTTQGLPIVAGKTYSIDFWVRGHGSIRTSCYKGAGNSSGAYYPYNAYIVLDTIGWKHCSQNITVDTTSAAAQFIFSILSTNADKDHLQIDDVTIDTTTAVPTPSVTIHAIQYSTVSPYISAYNGQVVTTGGIVSAKYNRGMFIQGGYGEWSGLYVYDSAHLAAANIARGDSVTITGTVSEYYTYTELGSITNVTKVSSGNTLHAAYPVTVVNRSTESIEAVLVKATNINCINATGSVAYGEFVLSNGLPDSVQTGGLLYKYTTATVGTHYDVTGLVYNSYGNVMRVEPRDGSDVSINTGITENQENNISIYPNPASSVLNIVNLDGVDQIRISNLLGQTVNTYNVSANSEAINVNNLVSGIYFVTLMKDNSIVVTRKFIKK